MAGPGRPKYEAPDGYYSISETAALLGITDAAVRGRIERGTLPSEEHMLENRELRRVIPKEAVNQKLADKNLPATKGDTGEVQKKIDENTLLLFEGLTAIANSADQHDKEVMARLDRIAERMDADRREVREYRAQVLEIMREQNKPWWIRWFSG